MLIMENESNIPLTVIPLSFAGNASVLNGDAKISAPTINLNSEDLSSKAQSDTDKNSITAVMKHSGEITGYELSNGDQVTKERGVELAKAGAISGISVATSRKGEEYLRSLRDEDESNNLSSLPTIQE
jgi:hypothetical protein